MNRVTSNSVLVGDSHLPLRDVVAAELRRLILDGSLPPGERLVEDRLAQQLGVSRNPIREAMRVLEAEGFLDVVSRRGAFVAKLSVRQADDLFHVRLALEPLGARLAAAASAEEPNTELLARAWAILGLVNDSGPEQDRDTLATLHTELHSLIFEMSRNDYLIAIAIPMVKRGQWLLRQNSQLQTPSAWSEHHGLIAAIEAGDADLAEAAARHHVLSVRNSLRPRLEPA
ncbi:GntR family transcriptional regulator [Kribbella sancticallisti]|uniref:GntR family transcriptional regulator n=1 Tax=Kribbella sancticallisti TaxID=460087 RepID=A0ABP4PHZ9_9ACTN